MAERETKSTVKIIAPAPAATATKYKAPAITVAPTKAKADKTFAAAPVATKARLDLR